jgi:hypothetical protein
MKNTIKYRDIFIYIYDSKYLHIYIYILRYKDINILICGTDKHIHMGGVF